ncbi:hypothetical protein FYJ86_05470 [Corynebacterium urealyticum]|nr:hypothetical protein FYJ86_05470 [Corynebacterium urealyticum]
MMASCSHGPVPQATCHERTTNGVPYLSEFSPTGAPRGDEEQSIRSSGLSIKSGKDAPRVKLSASPIRAGARPYPKARGVEESGLNDKMCVRIRRFVWVDQG